MIFTGRTYGLGRLTMKSGLSTGPGPGPGPGTGPGTGPTNPPVSDHLPSGGYLDRVGTRQHNSSDLLSDIYPVNTALSLGEFDDMAPGASYGLVHVREGMTIGTFIEEFNFGAVWGELSLVASKQDLSAADPGVLRLISTDEGEYDVIVRRPTDTEVSHADDLFVANVTNRPAVFPFDDVRAIALPDSDPFRTYKLTGTRPITEATSISSLLSEPLTMTLFIHAYYGKAPLDYTGTMIDDTGLTVGGLITALNAVGLSAAIVDGVMVADFGEFGGAVTLAQDGYGAPNRFPEMFLNAGSGQPPGPGTGGNGLTPMTVYYGGRRVYPSDPISEYTRSAYPVETYVIRLYSDADDLTQFEDFQFALAGKTLQDFVVWADTVTDGRAKYTYRGSDLIFLDAAYSGVGGNLLWLEDLQMEPPYYEDRFRYMFDLEASAGG